MDTYQISRLIAIALAIAVLVILIVVLTRNTLSKAQEVDVAPSAETMEGQIVMLDNKINWLFALEIASVGIMVLFGLIGFFSFIRISNPCA
jgi:hypothetical protein